MNEIAEQTYNPLLSGVGLRPIPTAENPTVQRPLSTMPGEGVQSPSTLSYANVPQAPIATTSPPSQLANPPTTLLQVQPTSSAPPLDMPTVGVETPTELALANTINANEANMQAQISTNQNPIYANMLNSALQKVANQNLQARIAQNYQNTLYLQSLYNVLMQSGMSPAQITAILENQYNAINSNIINPTSPKPIIADMPYTPANISRLRQEQQAAALQAALQQIAEYNKAPFIPIVTPMVAFNPQPTLPLQSPIATSSIPPLTQTTLAVSPAIAFNPQPILQSSAASPISTPLTTFNSQSSKASPIPLPSAPITPFPLLSINPNVFVENLNLYAGGLPPSLAKTPIVEETLPPISSGKRIPQLVRLPA